jgi:hypothetical protein
MVMTRILASALLTAVTCVAPSRADEPPPKPPELKVLDRYVGSWDTQMTIMPAEWTPKEVRVTGTAKCEWILDGRLLQGKGSDTSKADFLLQWTYDVERKEYRSWFFNSTGAVLTWGDGKWDPAAKSLVMKQSLGNGIANSMTARFVDADTIVFTSQAKGQDGKVLFAMEAKWTRRK